MSFKAPAMPASLGRCADLYKVVNALRLAMEKEAEEVKSFEAQVKQHIIDNLSKSGRDGGDTGAAGLLYRAQIVTKEVPKIISAEDGGEGAGWPQLWAFITRTGRFDLLQKRLGEKAIKDMWEAGMAVPGVERMHVPDVSITKI